MTSYALPVEPDGPVWLDHPDRGVERWTRHPTQGAAFEWHTDGEFGPLDWAELLALGEVSDRHPAVEGLPLLPWCAEHVEVERPAAGAPREFEQLVDDLGEPVARIVGVGRDRTECDRVARFIAEAANGYGALVTAATDQRPARPGQSVEAATVRALNAWGRAGDRVQVFVRNNMPTLGQALDELAGLDR